MFITLILFGGAKVEKKAHISLTLSEETYLSAIG